MIYGRDHAIRKNAKAPTDVVKELEMIEANNEAQWENLNVENMRDDIDDNFSFSLASRKHPKIQTAHQYEGEEMRIRKSLENLKS